MNNLISWLEGKKTYIVAGLAVTYAISGFLTGHIDQQGAIEMILAAVGGMTMRSAIEKK